VRLLLVRHAQSASNVGGALDTAIPGAALTDLGHEQAARLVSRLADRRLDAVAASPLTRAQQTAEPVAAGRGLAVITLDGLREIEAGDFEMHNSARAIDAYRSVIAGWATGALELAMPGGPPGHEFLARFDEAVRTLAGAGAEVVAVSHGAAIRTWVAARCGNVDAATVAARGLANTGVAVVEGSAHGGWQLTDWLEEIVDDVPATGLTDAGGRAGTDRNPATSEAAATGPGAKRRRL
jgi:broad specificity phosphatase PhoE